MRIERRWLDLRGLQMHARLATTQVAQNAPRSVLVHSLGLASSYCRPFVKVLAPLRSPPRLTIADLDAFLQQSADAYPVC